MCDGLLKRVEALIKNSLQSSGLAIAQITAVETIGGGTRLSTVLSKLQQVVGSQLLSQTLNREEAIARACAIQCAMLSPVFKVRDFSVSDILLFPVKVSVQPINVQDPMSIDNEVHDLFPLNTTIPSTKAITVYRKEPFKLSIDYTNIELLPPGTKTHIATSTISTIPVSKGDSPRIKVIVKLDVHGIVSIENAEFIDSFEEEVPVPTPAPTTTTTTPAPTTTNAPPTQTNNEQTNNQQDQPKEEESNKPKEEETNKTNEGQQQQQSTKPTESTTTPTKTEEKKKWNYPKRKK